MGILFESLKWHPSLHTGMLIIKEKQYGCPTDNMLQFLIVRPSFWLFVYLEQGFGINDKLNFVSETLNDHGWRQNLEN